MIIEFNKLIYDKDSVYSSKKIWTEYCSFISLTETKSHYVVTIENNEDIPNLFFEFSNFVLDKVSAQKVGQ